MSSFLESRKTTSNGGLKVLHVWDVANVASTIARYMDKCEGTESEVIVRRAFTPHGFPVYGRIVDGGQTSFWLNVLFEARNYDILHVHDFDRIVPVLRRVYKKPVVLTYHSIRMALQWERRRRRWSKANVLTVVTENLLREPAVLTPNPVDTERFYDRKAHREGTALYLEYGNAWFYAQDMAERLGLEITSVPRNVPFEEMPALLSNYEYLLDFRISKASPELVNTTSKTALEALACGTKVVTWEGKLLKELPPEHRPEHVARVYYEIYRGLAR